MKINKYILLLGLIGIVALSACEKKLNGPDPNPNPDSPAIKPYKLSYGDSVFYIKNSTGDYTINPTEVRTRGYYYGFPEGIDINEINGAIRVSKSETGLRYKVYYVDSTTHDTSSTIILISGINYFDKIYNLSAHDTVAFPVYNATPTNTIPSSSIFDEGAGCNGIGVSVNTNNAVINLAQTIRNGVFGNSPSNGAQKEVELKYRVNDGSGKTLNSLKVKLYYFNTSNDLTADLVQLLKDREGTIFGAGPVLLPRDGQVTTFGTGPLTVKAVAKPRPPCIFIVGRL